MWFGWVVVDLVSKHIVNGSLNEGLILLSGGDAVVLEVIQLWSGCACWGDFL